MRLGCFEAYACVSACYDFAKQALAATVIQFNKIKCDPEAFQKTCIIAHAIIREINFSCHTHYLPHFVEVLDVAPSFDFYGFCRLPRYFLHPYAPQCLDEYPILDQLEVVLCDNWGLGSPDDEGQNRDPSVRQFAQEQLAAFLERMVEEDLDFRTEGEVKDVFYNWLEATLEEEPEEGFDSHNIDLQELVISLKKESWLEKMSEAVFIGVDIACVPSFLRIWSLIDLVPYAEVIGRFPFLSWVPEHNLDDWIWGAMGVGHMLKFLNAATSLWKGGLMPAETKDAKWLMAASVAECFYAFSNLHNNNHRLINFLALIAKSLGLLAFCLASKPTFFNDE